MAMNALQQALVRAGFAEEPKRKKRHGKQFTCNKCGNVMISPDNTNLMYCPHCDSSYFIFDNK